MLFNFFIWRAENPPRADKSALGAINRPLRMARLFCIRSLVGEQRADPPCSLADYARISVNHWFLPGCSGDGFFLPYLPGRSLATSGSHTVKSFVLLLNLA